ncbi:hypothetical protein [Schaalia sp. lx-100]|uniref:hypothetical protein n=1 Tax=Schaalia sp. lx-100 TaxID=2899081 RepID=UPI001E49564F|nr:hypothetical protein [Schaalia sp. lx-100]MCD4558081.1 hypothetical protein [Schaalia sp. lx-100]
MIFDVQMVSFSGSTLREDCMCQCLKDMVAGSLKTSDTVPHISAIIVSTHSYTQAK